MNESPFLDAEFVCKCLALVNRLDLVFDNDVDCHSLYTVEEVAPALLGRDGAPDTFNLNGLTNAMRDFRMALLTIAADIHVSQEFRDRARLAPPLPQQASQPPSSCDWLEPHEGRLPLE